MVQENHERLHNILKSEINTFGLYNIYEVCRIENNTSLIKERIHRVYGVNFSAKFILDYFTQHFYNQEDIKTSARKMCHLK